MEKKIYVVKRDGRRERLDVRKIHAVLRYTIEPSDLSITESDLAEIEMDAHIQFKDNMTTEEIQQILIRTAAEKISAEKPDFTYVAARLLLFDLYKRVNRLRGRHIKERKENAKLYKPYDSRTFIKAFEKYTEQGLYGHYLLSVYRTDNIERFYRKVINPKYDLQFTYPGLKLLVDRYLVRDRDDNIVEMPQEMYMLIALTLALPDYEYVYQKTKNRYEAIHYSLKQAERYYHVLASHKATVATPTLMNARRPFTQLSSCFVLTVDDDLYDMYDNLQKMAQVSKYAGGLGVYIGKIRATGSEIQNRKGTNSGIIPYVKLINDTMTYVDQLGMRKGSASVTLDIWHKDILDFLEVKTNVGDERKKAHDIHPAISIPDIFMKRLLNREKWTLIDPYIARHYIGRKILDAFKERVEQYAKKYFSTDAVKVVLETVKQSANSYDYIVRLVIDVANIDSSKADRCNQFIEAIIRKRKITDDFERIEFAFIPDTVNKLEYVELLSTDFDIYKTKESDTTVSAHINIQFAFRCPGLEDFYAADFEKWYTELEKYLPANTKKEVDAFELMKRIITVAFETGEPYIFFRDEANRKNPNKHIGLVYSSNLCHEIVQSMVPSKTIPALKTEASKLFLETDSQERIQIEHRTRNIGRYAQTLNSFVPSTTSTQTYYCDIKKAGIIPVCNLASINLGKIDNDRELEHVVKTLVRMLDNVIDLNFYAFYETARTNKLFRAIGIGISNYHYWLVKNNIRWEAEEHIKAVDKLFEKIAFYAVEGSMELARERGKYLVFDGSDWSKGIFFGKTVKQLMEETRKTGNDLPWDELADKVKQFGLRNAYLLALMPTGSTSLIVGATPSIDPIFAKFYKEENLSGVLPQVPPEIDKYYWHYKTAYTIDHIWTIRAAAARQKWIDQAQSLNLYIDPANIDGPTLMSWYIEAWKLGLKTIYYLRSKSVTDIDECESCSA